MVEPTNKATTIINRLSLPIPPEHRTEFGDIVVQENAIRTVIGFVVTGIAHLFYLWLGWQRYQQGLFEQNPLYRWIFYSDMAWWLLSWIPIEFAWNWTRIRRGQYPVRRLRLLVGIIILWALAFPLLRAAANFQFNHALGFYASVLIAISFFVLNLKTRLWMISVSVVVMVAAVFLQNDLSFAESLEWVMYILALSLLVFLFSTVWYNNMVRQFLNEKKLAEQKEQLTEQGIQLSLQNQVIEADKELLTHQLEITNRQLTSFALRLAKKQNFLDGVITDLSTIDAPDTEVSIKKKRLLRKIEQEKTGENDWKQFQEQFELVHPNFFTSILELFPFLSVHELRLMALLKMNFATHEISAILNISSQSTNTARYRLKKRLGLQGEGSLFQFVHQFGRPNHVRESSTQFMRRVSSG